MKHIVALQYHKKKISGEVSADLSLFRWGGKKTLPRLKTVEEQRKVPVKAPHMTKCLKMSAWASRR